VRALLALTDGAVQAVKDIVSSAEVAETGGLRMVAERAGMQANLQLNVVPLPAEEDEVIEEQGAELGSAALELAGVDRVGDRPRPLGDPVRRSPRAWSLFAA
jgi:Fe-S cluster assembly iron-binding protein IscA